MVRLFTAFLFKLRKDATFKVTLIIGAGVAIFMCLLYFAIDMYAGANYKAFTGQTMLINSLSPVQNFGFAIPINLISFICLEFTQGTIRNKIIAGNSKFKIYASLFLSGLVFAFALIIAYAGICTGIGAIFGGFDLSKYTLVNLGFPAVIDWKFIVKTLIIYCLIYVFVTSFAVFVATTFRVVGPAIPVVTVTLMLAFFGAYLVTFEMSNNETVLNILKFADPLYAPVGANMEYFYETVIIEGQEQNVIVNTVAYYDQLTFIGSFVSTITYSAIFFAAGAIEFVKRDVK